MTLLSQQIRALNLIYSLVELDQLKKGDRVAVIGGGAAGLTATAAAAVCGCKATVFEAKSQLLHLQANCTKRWVHPHIYDWPDQGSLDESASEIEILVWHAATAGQVADQLLSQWKQLREALSEDQIDVRAEVTHLTITAQEELTWTPGFQHGEYQAIILALGFGLERSFPPLGLHSYWRDDELDQDELLEGRRFLVSGTGDGGLTDLLRLCVRRFRHDEMVRDFGLTIDRPKARALADQLMDIEKKAIQAEHPNKWITIAYQELKDVEWVDALLRDRLKKSGVVRLNGLDPFPLSLDASVLNRFLASRLLALRAADYWQGEISNIERVDGHFQVTLETGRTDAFDKLVIRHGTNSALQASFPKIAIACERELRPRNELDQTRFQIWPPGWFLDRLSQRAAKPLPPPLKKQSPVPKSAANADLPRDWRDNTRKPSGQDNPLLAGRALHEPYLDPETRVYLEKLRESREKEELYVHIPIAGETDVSTEATLPKIKLPRAFIFGSDLDNDKAASQKEKRVVKSIKEALKLHNKRFVLLGDSGSGKSFSLLVIRDKLAQDVMNGVTSLLPLIIDLGKAREHPTTLGDIFEEEKNHWGLQSRSVESLALLIDGLNDLAADEFVTRSKELRDWLRQRKHVPIIVACTSDFYSTLVRENGFDLELPKVAIFPLSEAQQKEFIKAYLNHIPEELNRLLFEQHPDAHQYEQISSLAASPFFLGAIIFSFVENNHNLPTKAGELLKSVIDKTFREHRTAEGTRGPCRAQLEGVRNALSSIALAMCKHGASAQVHKHWVESYVDLDMPLGDVLSIAGRKDIVRVDPERTGLIRFSHQILRDYLAAEALAKDVQRLKQLTISDAKAKTDTFSNVLGLLITIDDPNPYLRAIADLNPVLAYRHADSVSGFEKVLDGTMEHIARALVQGLNEGQRDGAIDEIVAEIGHPAIAPLLEGLSMSPPGQVRCLYLLLVVDPQKAVSSALDLVMSGTRTTRKAVQAVVSQFGNTDAKGLGAIVREKWVSFTSDQKQRVAEIFHRLWPDSNEDVSMGLSDALGDEIDLWRRLQQLRQRDQRSARAIEERPRRASVEENLALEELSAADSRSWPLTWLSSWKRFNGNADLAREGRRWLEEAHIADTAWPTIWKQLLPKYSKELGFCSLGYAWLVQSSVTHPLWGWIWQDLYVYFSEDARFIEKAYKWLRGNVANPSSQAYAWQLLIRCNPTDPELVIVGKRLLTELGYEDAAWTFVWELMKTIDRNDKDLYAVGIDWLKSERGNATVWAAVFGLLWTTDRTQLATVSVLWLEDLDHPQWPVVWLKVVESSEKGGGEIWKRGKDWLERASIDERYWPTVWSKLVEMGDFDKARELRKKWEKDQHVRNAPCVQDLRTTRCDTDQWPIMWRILWYDTANRPALTEIGLNWLQEAFSHHDWVKVFKRLWLDATVRSDLEPLGEAWVARYPLGDKASMVWRLLYARAWL